VAWKSVLCVRSLMPASVLPSWLAGQPDYGPGSTPVTTTASPAAPKSIG
jgi:hypothetical protein